MIDTVLVIKGKNLKKQCRCGSKLKNNLHESIWNTYKDSSVEEEEGKYVNHVRLVVQPLEKRLENMEVKLERMEKLLLKLAEK